MKKFLTLLIMLIALVSVASCDNNPVPEGGVLEPDQIDTSKETVVTFYHANGAAIQEVIQEIIDNFQEDMYEQYGVRVTVEQTSQGDYDTLRQTIASSIASGNQPTVAQTYPDHVSLYLEGEAVASLDKYIEHKSYGLEGSASDSYGYIDRFWAEGSIYDKEGTTYSIPFNKSTEVLFYNKNLFDKYGWEVPATWDDVIAICEDWKQTAEYQKVVDSKKDVGGIGIDSEANFFITLIQQWGGQYTGFDKDGNGTYLFDNPKAKAALAWLVEEFNKGNTVTSTHLGTNYCSDAFKAGQLPMTIGSSAGASYNVVTDGSFVTGVAPYPQVAGASEDEKQVIQQGTNITLFESRDKQEELFGWLFMKYLTNYESSLNFTLNTAYFPIRKDVAASEEYQKYVSQILYDEEGNPQVDKETGEIVKQYDAVKEVCVVGLAQAPYFYTSVAFPGSAKARTEGELIIQEILYNQETYSIDKAIADALAALKND